MNSDGSTFVKLTQGPIDGEPAWSPDGKKLAFARRQGTKDGFQIITIGVDGAEIAQLTTSLGSNEGPEWSPDGKHIAYTSFLSPQDRTVSQIYVMGDDGSNPQKLTDGKFENDWPRWSPDGQRIAYELTRDKHSQIYVMNIDGTNQTNLSNSEFEDASPKWSPDGNSIAFSRWQKSNQQAAKSLGVYVVRLDVSITTPIEKRNNMDAILTYQAYDFAWSPDSKRIALALADMIHSDSLYVADVSCLSAQEICSSVKVTDFIAKYNLYEKLDHGIGNSVSWFLMKN